MFSPNKREKNEVYADTDDLAEASKIGRERTYIEPNGIKLEPKGLMKEQVYAEPKLSSKNNEPAMKTAWEKIKAAFGGR